MMKATRYVACLLSALMTFRSALIYNAIDRVVSVVDDLLDSMLFQAYFSDCCSVHIAEGRATRSYRTAYLCLEVELLYRRRVFAIIVGPASTIHVCAESKIRAVGSGDERV